MLTTAKKTFSRTVQRILVGSGDVRSVYPNLCVIAQLPQPVGPREFRDCPPIAKPARFNLSKANEKGPLIAAFLPGALYHPGRNVLLAGRGRLLKETENVWREFPDREPHQGYYWRDQWLRPTRRMRGAAMAFRSAANNYYHTLIDNLPRLYWLHQRALQGLPVTLMVPGALRPWEAHFLPELVPESTRIVAVDHTCLWTADDMLFGDYLSSQMWGKLPQAWLEIFLARVLPPRTRRRKHRIYISRRSAPGGRRLLNEPEVINMLSRYGFQPYALEELAVHQQIKLFYDAEVVVAPHGAGLTNILFSERIDVVEFHPCAEIMPHYYAMATGLGHRYHYLCSNKPGRHDSFSVDISGLEAMISTITPTEPGK